MSGLWSAASETAHNLRSFLVLANWLSKIEYLMPMVADRFPKCIRSWGSTRRTCESFYARSHCRWHPQLLDSYGATAQAERAAALVRPPEV